MTASYPELATGDARERERNDFPQDPGEEDLSQGTPRWFWFAAAAGGTRAQAARSSCGAWLASACETALAFHFIRVVLVQGLYIYFQWSSVVILFYEKLSL